MWRKSFWRGWWTKRELQGLTSDEHFTVDGTLLEAWAGAKSFQPKDKKSSPCPERQIEIVNWDGLSHRQECQSCRGPLRWRRRLFQNPLAVARSVIAYRQDCGCAVCLERNKVFFADVWSTSSSKTMGISRIGGSNARGLMQTARAWKSKY